MSFGCLIKIECNMVTLSLSIICIFIAVGLEIHQRIIILISFFPCHVPAGRPGKQKTD